jgi:predicted phosphodiesterase
MKVGILGDIHANLEALNTCLTRLVKKEGCDYVMATGDVVGYGPQPKECIERLMELDIRSVRGNHDEYVTQDATQLSINPFARYVIDWTRNELEDVHMNFLKKLPDILDVENFSITHASNSPTPQWDYVLESNTAKANFEHQVKPLCFNGHTHLPMIISEDPHGKIGMNYFEKSVLEHGVKYLINAGSVGQPRDGNPHTGCLTYDTETREVKALRFKYNFQKVQKLMRQLGFPEQLSQRLEIGR